MLKGKWLILSVGGSIVIPNKINKNFLKKFRDFILKWAKKGRRFIIFIGGGKTARYYQKEAKKIGILNRANLDWIGIYATYLNASLILGLFKNKVYSQIIQNPTKRINTNKKIIIAGGWKPGWSTDYDAVRIARLYDANTVINLSDIDYVYNKDPDKFKDATPLKNISFSEFFKIGGKKWSPGLNLPFDPIASKFAKEHKIKVIILKGTDLKNLDKLFQGENFKGTIIQD